MTAELFARISAVATCYDTKLPDGFVLTDPVIVVSEISDVPEIEIDGHIAYEERRISCDVQALALPAARTVKRALIAALQDWTGGSEYVTFASGGPELYDWDLAPPRYCLPVDFEVRSC